MKLTELAKVNLIIQIFQFRIITNAKLLIDISIFYTSHNRQTGT